MGCTAYIVYTFHISLHHANFCQFKAKQVLSRMTNYKTGSVEYLGEFLLLSIVIPSSETNKKYIKTNAFWTFLNILTSKTIS